MAPNSALSWEMNWSCKLLSVGFTGLLVKALSVFQNVGGFMGFCRVIMMRV